MTYIPFILLLHHPFYVCIGFNGALSTVSTFVAELHTLYLEKGPLVALRFVS